MLGSSSKLMRPPYGAITDDIRNSLDLSFIMWDVDSLDWKNKNEAAILTEIQREVKNGSIILMHVSMLRRSMLYRRLLTI